MSGFGLASGTVLKNGGEEGVFAGGTDISATVSSGGGLFIHSGGIASGATIKAGGLGVVESGSVLSGTTTVTSGGTIEFIGTDASNNGLKLLSGATGELGSGAFLTDAKISKGITLVILSGGIASGGSILAGGLGILESGGQVTGDGSGSSLFIASGGTFEFASGTNGGSNIQPLSGATLEVGSGAAFPVNKIDAGITVKVLSGAALTLSGATISTGALVETLSSGTIIVSGALADSGTLMASGIGSLVEIDSGAVVSGGAVVVGNGLVDVLSGGSASVRFLSNGSGGLEIADTDTNPSTFSGTVSGFGGVNHTNHKQFIDLVSVASAPNTISLSYVSAAANTSGTLFVSSGGVEVAAITMVGHYSAGNFHITAGSGGTVEIVDPTVVNGGSVAPGPATRTFPGNGVDLPNIAFGAQTTLAYSQMPSARR